MISYEFLIKKIFMTLNLTKNAQLEAFWHILTKKLYFRDPINLQKFVMGQKGKTDRNSKILPLSFE